jgi:hypothetical protein
MAVIDNNDPDCDKLWKLRYIFDFVHYEYRKYKAYNTLMLLIARH